MYGYFNMVLTRFRIPVALRESFKKDLKFLKLDFKFVKGKSIYIVGFLSEDSRTYMKNIYGRYIVS